VHIEAERPGKGATAAVRYVIAWEVGLHDGDAAAMVRQAERDMGQRGG
jgi:hypothetical protein